MYPIEPRNGRLFVLEGIDGTGKTTQVAALTAWLRGLGLVVQARREPTMGPHGRRLRESAKTGRLSVEEELRLLELDRRAHVTDVIGPALVRGEVVVLDRYYFSTAAYQGARGADPAEIVRHHESFAPRPDLTLVLDLAPETSRQRIVGRGEVDAFEGLEDLRRCRTIFQSLLADDVRLFDASVSPEELTPDLAAALWRVFEETTPGLPPFPEPGLGDASWQERARLALATSPGLLTDDSGTHG
ncbi:MAG: dTMP kinase [Myxococcota bacterium]